MERTELREDFFKQVKEDPYMHMITRLCGNMWAEGYRQAQKIVTSTHTKISTISTIGQSNG